MRRWRKGVLKTMLPKKRKIATVVLLVAVLGVAAVVVQSKRQAKGPGEPKILDLGSGQRGRYVAWSPDGQTLAVVTKYESMIFGHKGSAVKLWDVEQGQVRQKVAESKEKWLAFQQVVFSADGKTIAGTVNVPGTVFYVVQLWDAETLALKQTVGGGSDLVCVALSADGKLVAAGDPGKKTITLWNAATGALERTFPTPKTQPWSLVFSPDSKTLVIGGQNDDHSGEVEQWDAQTWALKHLLKQDN